MVMKTKINDDEDDIFLPGYIIKVPAIQARLKADQTRRPGDQSRAGQSRARRGGMHCVRGCNTGLWRKKVLNQQCEEGW